MEEEKGEIKIDIIPPQDGQDRAEDAKKEKFIEIKKEENVDIIDALKLISPGTPLRNAINDIFRGKRGSLIAVATDELFGIIEGGFKLNCRFTAQRLFELSKMDGALVISKDFKRILYANSLLTPNPSIPTNETGTRHKAADRTAKQAKTLVIAISERRNTTTIYYHNLRYSLRSTEEIFNKTIDKLQILDKQREIYNNLISNLNRLEVTGLATSSDVSSVLQRIEIILRVSETIRRDIVELGTDGNLVKIRFKELTKGVEKDRKLILKDYITGKNNRYLKEISKFNFDTLLETLKISELVFGKEEESYVKPRGYRLLEKIGLPDNEISYIISKFPDVNSIFDSSISDFEKVFRDKEFAEKFAKDISTLKENIVMERGF